MNYLVACAVGAGHHIGHSSNSFGGNYFCPKHLNELMASFDPKPRDQVKFIDGDRSPWIVLGRDGDMVTLRRLGFPESKIIWAKVWNLWPGCGSSNKSFTPGCGPSRNLPLKLDDTPRREWVRFLRFSHQTDDDAAVNLGASTQMSFVEPIVQHEVGRYED